MVIDNTTVNSDFVGDSPGQFCRRCRRSGISDCWLACGSRIIYNTSADRLTRETCKGDEKMAKGAGKARKKLPKALAVVNADNCTGCEACVEVCPVDCIYKVPG